MGPRHAHDVVRLGRELEPAPPGGWRPAPSGPASTIGESTVRHPEPARGRRNRFRSAVSGRPGPSSLTVLPLQILNRGWTGGPPPGTSLHMVRTGSAAAVVAGVLLRV